MRIGILSGEYPPMKGGVGDYTWCVIEALTKRGHDVLVLARPEAVDTRPQVHLDGSMTHWGLKALFDIRQWALDTHLDVLNVQFQTSIYDMSPWIHFLPRVIHPLPIVVTFHDLLFPYLFPKAGFLRPWIVRELARTADVAVVTNHEDLQTLQAFAHATLIPIGSNIQVNATSEDDKQRIRTELGASQESFIVAHFGFLYPNRGAEYLLQALADLLPAHPHLRVVFIGGREGGPAKADYVAQLDQQIVALGIAEHVTWTGFLESADVSATLQAIDAVVLPFLDGASYRRGSLMASIEHTCAIITTQPNVTIPTFVDGENMLLVPPSNAQAIATALLRLMEQPALTQHLRTQVASLKSEFDWATLAQQFERLFEQVVKRTPTRKPS